LCSLYEVFKLDWNGFVAPLRWPLLVHFPLSPSGRDLPFSVPTRVSREEIDTTPFTPPFSTVDMPFLLGVCIFPLCCPAPSPGEISSIRRGLCLFCATFVFPPPPPPGQFFHLQSPSELPSLPFALSERGSVRFVDAHAETLFTTCRDDH